MMELERIVEQMRQEGQQIPYPETTTLAHPTNLQMPNFPKKPKTVQQAKVPDDVPAEAKEVLVRLLCRAGSAGRAGSGDLIVEAYTGLQLRVFMTLYPPQNAWNDNEVQMWLPLDKTRSPTFTNELSGPIAGNAGVRCSIVAWRQRKAPVLLLAMHFTASPRVLSWLTFSALVVCEIEFMRTIRDVSRNDPEDVILECPRAWEQKRNS